MLWLLKISQINNLAEYLFCIMAVWLIGCGVLGISEIIAILGAAIPFSIALILFMNGMAEWLMKELLIYQEEK